ncbi:protein THYLAKOID ASSEMBLY 8, chloroplastic [Punica granatum]|uniref:Uncharacterized protein n=2 Tax=Punica granatum TaxID=22663 RepID=A0A218WUP5_PUNGR|nr:protein THYLAKOID ASSEMBLY 8, chloroplastic [Punica granatum]OWM76495.1 hypothetical protein CDL15_Pgr005459 [Punica granatum]PKI71026.1 hypothetical protein CRG98_008607 [Punica granatum]
MASSLLGFNPNPFLKPIPAISPRHTATVTGAISAPTHRCYVQVSCGPRDGRGPLVKGRTLSIEAIQAVQSLKRAKRSNSADASFIGKTLSRLIKSDLVAALRELLRQGECALALFVLAALRSEYPGGTEYLSLYADVAHALARSGEAEAIDELVAELERDGGAVDCRDRKGLGRLLTAVIGAERRESTVRICGMMRRSGWESTCTVDEHVVKVLIRGLRKFGEVGLVEEIERELGGVIGKKIEKMEAHTS